MKLKQYLIGLLGLTMLGFTGCEDPDLSTKQFTKGLLDVKISIPGDPTEYAAVAKGPYDDGETIVVRVPTTEEEPLDVTSLILSASLENDSKIVPGLTKVPLNFTEPYALMVTDGSGVTKTFHIQVVPTLPKTIFNKVMLKPVGDLGCDPSTLNMTFFGDNLVVANAKFGYYNQPFSTLRFFDPETMAYTNTEFKGPIQMLKDVKCDDAGNMIWCQYNAIGSGFRIYLYKNGEKTGTTKTQVLRCPTATFPHTKFGSRVSVVGNMVEGKAYVIVSGTGQHDTQYTWGVANAFDAKVYYWEFIDGKVVDENGAVIANPDKDPGVAPRTIDIPGLPEGKYSFASIERSSVEPNADHYVGYTLFDQTDANGFDGTGKHKYGSGFGVLTSTGDFHTIDKKNFLYIVLRTKVFKMGEETFLATLMQYSNPWTYYVVKVFNITDHSKFKMIPGDTGYNDFCVFESEPLPLGASNNNEKTGDIAIKTVDNVSYIYCAIPYSGIHMYRMRYFPVKD